jgi:hypothetical protein
LLTIFLRRFSDWLTKIFRNPYEVFPKNLRSSYDGNPAGATGLAGRLAASAAAGKPLKEKSGVAVGVLGNQRFDDINNLLLLAAGQS